MRWHHGHSWAAGILTGIVISQHAIILVVLGGILFFLFSKVGALYRTVMWRLNRRWAIRP
jgi:glucose uptake protein GlcU